MAEKFQGVYEARKKDNSIYYRASLTHRGKHVSLGSYETAKAARKAYLFSAKLLREGDQKIIDYDEKKCPIPFDKWVLLINMRDNGMYCNGPIYLRNRYFEYYLDPDTVLRFGADELFYYTHHGIQRRGGHLFVADYGMQVNILNRYGIRNFAVKDKDYYFKNGDCYDFRPGNVVVINRYAGVRRDTYRGKNVYTARIHVTADLVVGHYDTETDAAIAYNKAADILRELGVAINFSENYIEDMSSTEYRLRYGRLKVSKRIKSYDVTTL